MHMWQFTTLRCHEMDKIHLETSERTCTFNAYCKSKCKAAICRAHISYSIPIKLSAVMKACFEFNAGTPNVVALANLILDVDVAALSGVTCAFQVSSSMF